MVFICLVKLMLVAWVILVVVMLTMVTIGFGSCFELLLKLLIRISVVDDRNRMRYFTHPYILSYFSHTIGWFLTVGTI